jgi:hypothetical protein
MFFSLCGKVREDLLEQERESDGLMDETERIRGIINKRSPPISLLVSKR